MIKLRKSRPISQSNKKNNSKGKSEEHKQMGAFIKYMAPSGMDFGIKSSVIGDLFKAYYFISFPSYVKKEAWINTILKCPFVNINYYASLANRNRFISGLKATMNTLNSTVVHPDVTEYARTEAEEKLNNFKELQKNLLEGNEEIVNLTIILEVTGRSKTELANNVNTIKGTLSNIDMVGKLYMLKQKNAYISSMPLNTLDEDINTIGSVQVPSVSAACIYPISFSRYNESKGVYLGNDKMNGMVIVDFTVRNKDRIDSNIFVMGKSGTGKSATFKKLIKHDILHGRKVIVIDVEGEYKDLYEEYGGTWLNCAGGGGSKINILEITDFGSDLEDKDKKHPLVLQFHKLRNFFKLYSPELRKDLLMDYLEICFEQVYEDKGITFETDIEKLKDLESTEYPILEEVYEIILQKIEESRKDEIPNNLVAFNKLEKIIRRTVKGADKHLNGYTNINTDSMFTVLDVHELLDADENNLRAEMYNLFNFTWKQATTDRGQQANVYTDEYHVYGNKNNPQGLIALKNYVKRFRKYEAGLRVGTQNPGDVLDESVKEYTEAIINNSSYNFIFGLADNDLIKLDSIMHFSESEQILLSKKERGKALFVIGNQRIEIEIKLSDKDIALFSKKGGR